MTLTREQIAERLLTVGYVAERDLAMSTILALERWLDAIHVTRAQLRP